MHSPIKRSVLQHKINTKKLKPGLVASYDIRPQNGEWLFLFWGLHKFVPYLLTYPLTYSPGTHTGRVLRVTSNSSATKDQCSLFSSHSSSVLIGRQWVTVQLNQIMAHCSIYVERQHGTPGLEMRTGQKMLARPAEIRRGKKDRRQIDRNHRTKI